MREIVPPATILKVAFTNHRENKEMHKVKILCMLLSSSIDNVFGNKKFLSMFYLLLLSDHFQRALATNKKCRLKMDGFDSIQF